MSFSYLGTVPASKSIFNRLLVCQSYYPELQIVGQSQADDINLMKKALTSIATGVSSIDCGYAGTVFRFLTLKLARLGGEWQLNLKPELRQRPHDGLIQILGQLSIDWQWNELGMRIKSEGWRLQGDGLHVSMKTSSQFLSAVLLNAWNLNDDLFISINSKGSSKSYLDMTLRLVRMLGMDVQANERELIIPAQSKILLNEAHVEPDLSSAFSLAAVAAINGDATFQNFPGSSLQPDVQFVAILKKMGVSVAFSEGSLKVTSSGTLTGIDVDLSDSPDLFPSLATLCCLATGPSKIYGAPNLKFKESNRIQKVMELLAPLERVLRARDDGMEISGNPKSMNQIEPWSFDPSSDHRMAMAAAVLKKFGYQINIENPQVVDKSFPEFWSAIGITV